jgi:hypothetical protein
VGEDRPNAGGEKEKFGWIDRLRREEDAMDALKFSPECVSLSRECYPGLLKGEESAKGSWDMVWLRRKFSVMNDDFLHRPKRRVSFLRLLLLLPLLFPLRRLERNVFQLRSRSFKSLVCPAIEGEFGVVSFDFFLLARVPLFPTIYIVS